MREIIQIDILVMLLKFQNVKNILIYLKVNLFLNYFSSELVKQPPPAAFASPSGSAAFSGGKKKIGEPLAAVKKSKGAYGAQTVLVLPQGHEGSECA